MTVIKSLRAALVKKNEYDFNPCKGMSKDRVKGCTHRVTEAL